MAQDRSGLPVPVDAQPSHRVRLLLVLPFVAAFAAPVLQTPALFGVELVGWYHVLWALISGGLIYTVYRFEK